MTERKTTTKKKADGLYPKLLKAQEAASAVGKLGKNTDQGYSYARAEDVIEEAQRALHAAELVGYMVPGEVESTPITAKSGTSGLFVTVHSTLEIRDPESEELLSIPAIGTGIDYPGDKAIYKALTGGAKYAYAAALGIPFGDDPEDSGSTAPEARETASRGGPEATANQKRAMTNVLKSAGLARETIRDLVHAAAGDPPTKAAASVLLDKLFAAKDEGDEQLRGVVEGMLKEYEITVDVGAPPADTEGLDETKAQEAAEGFEVEPGETMFPPEEG